MTGTVMMFGTFDILHSGHLSVFKQACRLGKTLIVVVALDVTVKKIKKNKPVHNEKERLELLSHIDLIDRAVLGDPRDVYKVIKKYRPDIIALGYDQNIFVANLEKKLKEFSLSSVIVRLKPYKTRTKKSGKIKSLLLKNL